MSPRARKLAGLWSRERVKEIPRSLEQDIVSDYYNINYHLQAVKEKLTQSLSSDALMFVALLRVTL